MRKIFTPEEIAAWTEDDVNLLIGKYVVVEVPASEWYKEHCGGDREGGCGVCLRASLVNGMVDVEWDFGMGWRFSLNEDVCISVCDEHGDHSFKGEYEKGKVLYEDDRDPGAAECLSTLGRRGLEMGEQKGAAD